MGLVTEVVPDGALEERATALAERIGRHPRAGLAASKSAVAEIRAGRAGGEARAYAAALRTIPRLAPGSRRSSPGATGQVRVRDDEIAAARRRCRLGVPGARRDHLIAVVE